MVVFKKIYLKCPYVLGSQMSARQKHPGTTSPAQRVVKRIAKRLDKLDAHGGKQRLPDTKPKSGSKADRLRTKDPATQIRIHRKPGNKKKIEENINMDLARAVQYLLENHKRDVRQTLQHCPDPQGLSEIAANLMSTCFAGWIQTDHGLISEHSELVLSNNWALQKDGHVKLGNSFQFDYDWLYQIANYGLLTEAIDDMETLPDQDAFADALANASGLLRKLSDKEVKKYVLNAAKSDENIDITNLKEILEDTGVNWKFVGGEISGETINLFIKVKYSADGTQGGVVEKKLGIEVKPSADVIETERSQPDDELDLSFQQRVEED